MANSHTNIVDVDDIPEEDRVVDFEYVDEPNPTGEGLTKREAQKLLIEEMNTRIQVRNIINVRRTRGHTPLVAPFKGLKQLNQAVFMARQRGDYKELIQNAGFKP
jgi:hypothetical protein